MPLPTPPGEPQWWPHNVWFLMDGNEVLTNLALECCRRAAKQGVYIYIRCMDSGLIEGEKPGKLYWKCQAEFKSGMDKDQWRTWRSEGWSLDHVVREAVGQVPDGVGTARTKGKKVIRRTRTTAPSKPKKKVVVRRATSSSKSPSTQARRSPRKGRTS